MAAEFIYTANPATIGSFLGKIRSAGVPEKVTLKLIESFGYKTKTDKRLLPILKGLGLVSQSGKPTHRWNQYRDKKKGGSALADGIRAHYSALFALYPDAYQKDTEALHSFFSSHTTVSEATVKFMIATFKAVCALADFEGSQPTEVDSPVSTDSNSPSSPPIQSVISGPHGYTVNINIQLTLPENSDSKTFDDFFKSMRKNLLDEK